MYYACRLHYTRDPINTLMRATIYIFYIMFFLQSVLTKERSNKLLFYSFFINNIFKHNSPNNIYIFKKKYKTFSTNNSINKMWDNKNPFIAVYVTTPSKEIAESVHIYKKLVH